MVRSMEFFIDGIEPVEEDWEFTNYDEISREEYVNAVTKEEKWEK